MSAFEQQLETVLTREVAGVEALVSADRLSGGASQETYRLVVRTADGEQLLAMRRAPGGMRPSRMAETMASRSWACRLRSLPRSMKISSSEMR